VITIDAERCTGSGACVEVCPTGAIYLVEGRARVDQSLCSECKACIAACPTQAITLAMSEQGPAPGPVRLPARRPEPEVVQVRTQTIPGPFRTGVLPVVGAGLAWAGREILPRLADLLLDALDRRTARQQTTGIARDPGSAVRGGKGSGRQQRRRRRGGKRSS
jgi:NAD-dependent dihydropyrimidine dehydrogenase PreA subunit